MFMAGIVLCLLVVGYSLIRYPAILLPVRVGFVFLSIFLVILTIYFILGSRFTQSSSLDQIWILRQGLNWGFLTAGFWLIEIVAGNLADPQKAFVKLIYFGATVIAFVLPLFAGIVGARQFGTIRAGVTTGLWSGMVSGLSTFLILMAVADLFLNTSLKDPQNILQFQNCGAPDMVTFVIGDYLGGAIGHLVIGLVFGAGFGMLGGVIGIILVRWAKDK
jgi:hypothetical protein